MKRTAIVVGERASLVQRKLRRMRLERGLSAAAVARQAGTSGNRLRDYETGRVVPSEQTLVKLLAALERSAPEPHLVALGDLRGIERRCEQVARLRARMDEAEVTTRELLRAAGMSICGLKGVLYEARISDARYVRLMRALDGILERPLLERCAVARWWQTQTRPVAEGEPWQSSRLLYAHFKVWRGTEVASREIEPFVGRTSSWSSRLTALGVPTRALVALTPEGRRARCWTRPLVLREGVTPC